MAITIAEGINNVSESLMQLFLNVKSMGLVSSKLPLKPVIHNVRWTKGNGLVDLVASGDGLPKAPN